MARRSWPTSGLENQSAATHIQQMVEKSRTKLLEVAINRRSGFSWEWQVSVGEEVLVCGFESTRLSARIAAYDALFRILASGRSR
jgi:hypothetical protein